MAQDADTVRGGLPEPDLEDLEDDESLRACAFAALGLCFSPLLDMNGGSFFDDDCGFNVVASSPVPHVAHWLDCRSSRECGGFGLR